MTYATWYDIAPGLIEAQERAYYPNKDSTRPDPRVCPPIEYTFRALEMVRPQDVRVVILGQDPYHTPGKAYGVAFGYHPQYTGPLDSSLDNICREVRACTGVLDFGMDREDLTLEHWAAQGVLLLNTRLTVLEGEPMSHAYKGRNAGPNIGWEQPIQDVLKVLATQSKGKIVWLLWGAEARRLASQAGIVFRSNVITTSHPCRFSHTAGPLPFTGSRCFDVANNVLLSLGREKIKWA